MHIKQRKAFTMLELTFVIVVIGILSAIAIPRFAATRDDAIITKARTTVASLRSAISIARQKRVLKGSFTPLTGSEAESLLPYGLGTGWGRNNKAFTFTGPSGNSCVFNLVGSSLNIGTCGIPAMSDL